MDIVTLVNRTSKPLEGCFDGQRYVIGPRGEKAMMANAAEQIKRQNPLMGSEDPSDPRSPIFLAGIKEWDDDVSLLEQSESIERFDRSLTEGEGPKARPLQLRASKGSRVKVALDDDNPVGIQTG